MSFYLIFGIFALVFVHLGRRFCYFHMLIQDIIIFCFHRKREAELLFALEGVIKHCQELEAAAENNLTTNSQQHNSQYKSKAHPLLENDSRNTQQHQRRQQQQSHLDSQIDGSRTNKKSPKLPSSPVRQRLTPQAQSQQQSQLQLQIVNNSQNGYATQQQPPSRFEYPQLHQATHQRRHFT